jgi:hypothetical protein
MVDVLITSSLIDLAVACFKMGAAYHDGRLILGINSRNELHTMDITFQNLHAESSEISYCEISSEIVNPDLECLDGITDVIHLDVWLEPIFILSFRCVQFS